MQFSSETKGGGGMKNGEGDFSKTWADLRLEFFVFLEKTRLGKIRFNEFLEFGGVYKISKFRWVLLTTSKSMYIFVKSFYFYFLFFFRFFTKQKIKLKFGSKKK